MSKNDHYSFVIKLIIFWQAYTYKYWTILSNTQLDGEIESVHKKIFFGRQVKKVLLGWTLLDKRQVGNLLWIESGELTKINWKTFLKHLIAVGNMPVNQYSHKKDLKASILWMEVGKEVEFAKYAAITNVLK